MVWFPRNWYVFSTVSGVLCDTVGHFFDPRIVRGSISWSVHPSHSHVGENFFISELAISAAMSGLIWGFGCQLVCLAVCLSTDGGQSRRIG